jgi:general secretion pathway protein G
MRYEAQDAATRRRGDTVRVVRLTGHRVAMSTSGQKGFTLIELVITIVVLTILTMGVIPLVKLSVHRQKEQELRDALREMRTAIDQFHREALIYPCTQQTGGTGLTGGRNPPVAAVPPVVDPRIKVAITDCTIFGVDNPDRYPPDLDTLVTGVNVIPITGFGGGAGQQNVNATQVGQLSTKKKIYLRAIPINPFTGDKDWDFRSCYDPADAESWGHENVFDVRFPASKDQYFKPLKEGEKYSDW